jgi:hypothetical protein
MENVPVGKCPRCGSSLEQGFAVRGVGLSFVEPSKFEQFLFLDEDVSQSGLKKLLPSRAQYYRSCLCRSCRLYLIDYAVIYSRDDAEAVAASL